jgi:hypothetical protein
MFRDPDENAHTASFIVCGCERGGGQNGCLALPWRRRFTNVVNINGRCCPYSTLHTPPPLIHSFNIRTQNISQPTASTEGYAVLIIALRPHLCIPRSSTQANGHPRRQFPGSRGERARATLRVCCVMVFCAGPVWKEGRLGGRGGGFYAERGLCGVPC